MPSRRALLAALGTVAPVGTAGCLGRIRDGFGSDPPVEGPCDEPAATWPTAGGDPGRTGRTDATPPGLDADAVDLLAGVHADGRRLLASALPVVHGGTAVVPSGSSLVAVDVDAPGDGPTWRHDLEDDVDAVPTLTCGAVLAPGLNRLVTLDRVSGDRYWSTDLGSHSPTAVAPAGETTYVASFGPVAVDTRTGTVQWRAEGGDTLALDDSGVYTTRYADGTGDIFAHDLHGGERWHLSLGKIVGSASVLDGTVRVADNRGTVYAIDARTGETYWSRTPDGVGKIHSGLAVRGDDVVVPAGHGTTSVVLDAHTGETKWSVETGFVTSRPVVGDDWVAFGRTNAGVSLYDRATGEHRTTWSRDEYGLGTIDGVLPVKQGFVVREGTTPRLTLLR